MTKPEVKGVISSIVLTEELLQGIGLRVSLEVSRDDFKDDLEEDYIKVSEMYGDLVGKAVTDHLIERLSQHTVEEFRGKYTEDHKLCPECGTDDVEATCVGYVVDKDNLASYKDENKAKCFTCGWIGIVHDMVGIPEEE